MWHCPWDMSARGVSSEARRNRWAFAFPSLAIGKTEARTNGAHGRLACGIVATPHEIRGAGSPTTQRIRRQQRMALPTRLGRLTRGPARPYPLGPRIAARGTPAGPPRALRLVLGVRGSRRALGTPGGRPSRDKAAEASDTGRGMRAEPGKRPAITAARVRPTRLRASVSETARGRGPDRVLAGRARYSLHCSS